MSQKHEYRKANQNANPPHHIAAQERHVRRSSRAGSNVVVETRDRCRLLDPEAPASVEAPALLEVAAITRARSKLEGFAIRLRRRVTIIAASTVTSTEIPSVKVGTVIVRVVGPLILWDAAGRELGPNLAQRGVGEEISM